MSKSVFGSANSQSALFSPLAALDNGIKDIKLLEHEVQSTVSSYVFQALDSIASDTSHSLAQETCPSWVRSILVPGNLLYLSGPSTMEVKISEPVSDDTYEGANGPVCII